MTFLVIIVWLLDDLHDCTSCAHVHVILQIGSCSPGADIMQHRGIFSILPFPLSRQLGLLTLFMTSVTCTCPIYMNGDNDCSTTDIDT